MCDLLAFGGDGAGPMGSGGSTQFYQLTPAEAAKCTELLEREKTDVKGPLGKSVMIGDELSTKL